MTAVFAACLAVGVRSAPADIAQSGNLRLSFTGGFNPSALPRSGHVPVSVTIGGRIWTRDDSDPPPLRRLEIALTRVGRLDPDAVPRCPVKRIQPATTTNAIRACRRAKVGEGKFSASVAIPGQAPYPSRGDVTAFNGTSGGRPALLLHIYGTKPIPTSLTVPLRIRHARGTFGTVLTGGIPTVEANVGFVTGIFLRVGGAAGSGSRQYLTGGCPAPDGFPSAVFPFARSGFFFSDGRTLRSVLVRTCRALG